jgi:hypothetical protein
MLDERRRAEREEREAEEERRQAEDEDGGRGGRRRRGGRDDFDGGGFGRGYGAGGEMMTKDGAMVIQPVGVPQLQGFEEVRDTSWVIIKAKVPYRAQFKNYEEALASSRGYSPTEDLPVYIGYEVQRCEVTDKGDGDWQTIKKVVPKVLIDDMEAWPIQTPDLIDPKYNHPLLTYPLPPMVLRAWDESVTHSEMPIPTPEQLMGAMEGEDDREGRGRDGDEDEASGDLFQDASENRRPQGPMQGFDGRGGYDGGRGGFEGGYGRGFEGGFGRGGYDGGRGGFGRGGYDGGRGGFDGGRGGYGRGEGAGSVDPDMFTQFTWDGRTRYLLFRYFDFDRPEDDHRVEPGKRYRYRVRLAVKDVNADPIPERYLEEEVIARRTKENAAFRMSPWSEPTPIAVVPQAGLVYVAGAKPANASNFASEAEAELLIKGLDNRSASEAALEDMFTRGTVLNLMAQQAKVIWSSTFQAMDEDGNQKDSPKFNFRTGLTLLDFVGGETLNNNRELTAPARVVLMDSAGRITIKHELDDLKPVTEYDYYKESADEMARNAAEQERGDDRGGRGGRGGFGGGGRRRNVDGG